MERKTTIVATLGPVSSTTGMIEKLVHAGVDVFRLNFSHGSHEDHGKTVERIRRVEKRVKRPIGIMMDLQGPKIRVGNMPKGGVQLVKGATVTIVTKNVMGCEHIIPTVYKKLPDDVNVGDRILLNDGYLELKVTGKCGREVECQVKSGGLLTSHKGINLPGVNVSAPAMTKKDIEDLAFGLSEGVDFVALSFVRTAAEVRSLRKRIAAAGSSANIVSKIERPEAVENIDDIIRETDIVMIARGDLGVELEPELVPEIQKSIIEKANLRGKGVITATQMLESMITNKRPTRAEASDVANAVFDGSGGIMLSGETAMGENPLEAVRIMSRIAEQAEKRVLARPMREPSPILRAESGYSGTVAYAAVRVAGELGAEAIVAFTQSGTTARLVSKYRPSCKIFGATMSLEVARKMSMYWGVTPVVFGKVFSMETLVQDVDTVMSREGHLRKGAPVVITAGVPVGRSGTTNLIKIHRIGDKD